MAGTILVGLLTGAARLARRRNPTRIGASHPRQIDWLLGMAAVSFVNAVAADLAT